MEILGLTGGIASGKTTVRHMLEKLGAHVLDADAIYHELIQPVAGEPSPLARAIAVRFPGVLTPTHEIDRARLGAIVFRDASARADLNRVTHPAVAAAFAERLRGLEVRQVARVIYDVPLLFERGLQEAMRGVLVVWVPAKLQMQRLMAREHLTQQEAELRLQSQWPLEQKKERATWVIDNSGSVEATELQVKNWWQKITHPATP